MHQAVIIYVVLYFIIYIKMIGHEFSSGRQILTGRTCPWNTMVCICISVTMYITVITIYALCTITHIIFNGCHVIFDIGYMGFSPSRIDRISNGTVTSN